METVLPVAEQPLIESLAAEEAVELQSFGDINAKLKTVFRRCLERMGRADEKNNIAALLRANCVEQATVRKATRPDRPALYFNRFDGERIAR